MLLLLLLCADIHAKEAQGDFFASVTDLAGSSERATGSEIHLWTKKDVSMQGKVLLHTQVGYGRNAGCRMVVAPLNCSRIEVERRSNRSRIEYLS